jgi:CHAT domain-containing protein
LYEWLIRPFESQLVSRHVSTIVFVPDGLLRTIPIAALHDGKQFLIEKYALATTPGLSLTDPRPLQRGQGKVLAVGLTEAAQGFPALPGVLTELQALQDLYQVHLLVNQDFVLPKLERELRDEQLSIVHIASHGQFAGEVEKSFLLTFDDRLTMERLDQLIGLFKFRETPLEMLTLSACETAAGDDQAALGLAGIAIKAGARSALATLWHVNDPAASLLTAEFYRQLQNPAISRATALQQAQLQLMSRYDHPGYWAPFLLINNWL